MTAAPPPAAHRLDWTRDGHGWPHRETSRFVDAGGVRWHVQRLGPISPPVSDAASAPCVLLLHGTGASAHSWRGVLPRLAARCDVIAVDLPGHGFSSMPGADGLSLPGMARGLGVLLEALGARPAWIVGHSAGAAIAARMSLDGLVAPAGLIGINGALRPLGGLAGPLFTPLARLLAANPIVPRLFSRQASDATVLRRLIEGTGSTLDAEGLALYGRLVSSPGHAAAALGMMARWDLGTLWRDLPRLPHALHLLVGMADRTLAPDEARRILVQVAHATLHRLPGLGHLAHEERPDDVARLLLERVAP